MKRDKEKINRIRECIKNFYLRVSDKRIALKFAVSTRSVAELRRRMGLKKEGEVITTIRKGVKTIRRDKNNKRIMQ